MRQVKTVLAATALSITALSLVACTSQKNSCFAPYPPKNVAVVYPSDKSTGVSTKIGVVVVQGYFSAPPVEFVTVTTQSGGVLVATQVGPAPSPLPSPVATPPNVSGAPYGAVAVPMLSAQTTYQVQLSHSTPCFVLTDSSSSFMTGSTRPR